MILFGYLSFFLVLLQVAGTASHPSHTKPTKPRVAEIAGVSKPVRRWRRRTFHRSTCTDLVNHGTHFTVEIEVGTPGQKFDVVADTGSDAIIVPSCLCVKAGFCNSESRCFQGTNRSTTFAIEEGPDGPPSIRMLFGSGPVQAVVASDTVRVGKLHTRMKDGILLMTDQLLNIKGPFEGILGLGLPLSAAKRGLYREMPNSRPDAKYESQKMEPKAEENIYASSDWSPTARDSVVASSDEDAIAVNIFPFPAGIAGPPIMQSAPMLRGPDAIAPTMNLAPAANSILPSFSITDPDDKAKEEIMSSAGVNENREAKANKKRHEPEESNNDTGIVMKGFAEEAGIERFSMCFNSGAPGVLRLGTPKAKFSHGSVGEVHWGLDFRGISVGNISAPVTFCDPKKLKKGQKTPCGAIPDSGTTAFMAPKKHLISLYDSICDSWDRCRKNYTAMEKAANEARRAAENAFNFDPFHIRLASKAEVFQQLILDCRHWLSASDGLDELPSLNFHIAGTHGTTQTLELDGWSYIIETQEQEFNYIYKSVPGLGQMPVGKNVTGKMKKVCSPAFSPMEYKTSQNGAVWILGTPIFYEYQVGYDLVAKPPAMSFTKANCGSCSERTSLVSEQVSMQKKAREPRQVFGPLRVPAFDTSQPL